MGAIGCWSYRVLYGGGVICYYKVVALWVL